MKPIPLQAVDTTAAAAAAAAAVIGG